MKILIYDCELLRFSGIMKREWEKQGHEVTAIRYYDPQYDEKFDVIWFEWCDTSAQLFSTRKWNTDDGQIDLPPLSGKVKTACRTIDIDMWASHPGGCDWKNIDDAIFIAPHIRTIAEERFIGLQDTKVHTVVPGVELDKFPFVKKEFNEKKIAWVGNDDHVKGIDRAVSLLICLNQIEPGWTLHAKMTPHAGSYFWYYYMDLIKKNGLEDSFFVVSEVLPDMKDFYADKDYILVTSHKEAFSYAAAEGIATGLMPVIHRFYGADDIWPQEFLYTTEEDALNMFFKNHHIRRDSRDYAEEHLDAKRMVAEYNKILEI